MSSLVIYFPEWGLGMVIKCSDYSKQKEKVRKKAKEKKAKKNEEGEENFKNCYKSINITLFDGFKFQL